MKIKFKSFSSGSCGNCYFIGIEESCGALSSTHGVLIDAGVSPRRLKKELLAEGLDFSCLDAILITHDHMDHIRSLGSYCKHLQKPVWASETLMKALSNHFITGEFLGPCRRILSDGWNEVSPDIKVRYFVVPHDATQTVGFALLVGGHRYVHITDCGRMTPEALNWCSQAETITLESNYDPEMLKNGPYPKELQDRIRDGHGHLSNGECAAALAAASHPGLSRIFLCHLSEHNNTPQLALRASTAVFPDASSAPGITPLPRETSSPFFLLSTQ